MTATTPQVLERLDGWTSTPPTTTDYDVSGVDIIATISNAEVKASAYLGYDTPSTPANTNYFDNAVADWAAGLLWNRRETINTNYVTVNQEYGNTLIKQAKETLDLLKHGDTDADSPTTKKREVELLGFAYKWDKDTYNATIDTTLIEPNPPDDDDDDD